jgi:hypothetical protein
MTQKLSPAARRAKRARDKAYAMTPDRRRKKAHSQRERRKKPCPDGYDYDHKRQKCVSIASNRGNEGEGTKKESGNDYNTN